MEQLKIKVNTKSGEKLLEKKNFTAIEMHSILKAQSELINKVGEMEISSLEVEKEESIEALQKSYQLVAKNNMDIQLYLFDFLCDLFKDEIDLKNEIVFESPIEFTVITDIVSSFLGISNENSNEVEEYRKKLKSQIQM